MEIQCKLGGFFRFEAVNADTGEKRLLSDWHPNLITNDGLEQIGSGYVIGSVQVGSGQTSPNVNDTALAAFVAQTSAVLGSSQVIGASPTEPYYGFTRRTFRFPMGAAQGNLSEVGIRGLASNLFSRSLIKDVNGNPTTITVLANEFLDVTYELRVYAPTADVTSQFTIGSDTYDCTVRAAHCGNLNFWYPSLASHGASAITGTGPGAQGCTVYNGDIGSVTQGPSGTPGYCTVTQRTYTANNKYLEVDCDLDLNSGNLSGGIRSLRFTSNIGSYQAQFNPPIPKDNLRSLKMIVRFHWARRT